MTNAMMFSTELLLMFQLMDRVLGGVDPMIANLESYIVTTGLDDMKASADTITSVSLLVIVVFIKYNILQVWERFFPDPQCLKEC